MRHLFISGVLALLALSAWGLYAVSYQYFKSQDLEKAAARLTLYRSTLEAELQRFAHLPYVLSQDPFVANTLAGGDPEMLDERLKRFAESAGVEAIYLMDSNGLTISASNATASNSFKGQNYGFRPYFQEALNGALGAFYGIGATTGIPGYFYALAVPGDTGRPAGVIAIKLNLDPLQNSWQVSGERIIVSNEDGVILLASNPAWRYQTLAPLSETQRAQIVSTRQFGTEPLTPLDWQPSPAAQLTLLDGQRLLYLFADDLLNGWSLHYLAPDDQAQTRAWLVTGALVLLVGLGYLILQIRQVQMMAGALKRSADEEALLREANTRLAIEIEDRRSAEQALKTTQAELERAGRLAALGRLAASVTHELGQPIAAMRNQITAAEMRAAPTPLTTKLQTLVDRMEGITRQLKFFSRKGRDQFEPVDLREVAQMAVELLAPSIDAVKAEVELVPSEADVIVQGNKLRLEQVMTNLIRNALDAVEEQPRRTVTVAFGREDTTVWFEIADTGHGLGDQRFEDLAEPFTTSKASGKGMGLGLTISTGIVSDHGGRMSARTRPEGGAVFRVDLPQGEQQ